jgi:2-keto-4-pentenoate hydratase
MSVAAFSDEDARTFAEALIAARKPGAPRTPLPKVVPATDQAAYRVQDIVRTALGPAEGWKVGAANPTAEPNCSPVLKGGIISATSSSAPLSIPVPSPTGIETEIAFRMAKAFPAAAIPPPAADVLAAIGSAHVAMELCAYRLADGPKAPPHALLADNGMNLGFLIGPAVKDWRSIDAQHQVARAYVDGKAVVDLAGGHTQKDLAKLLVWVVGHVVTKRGGLPAGAIIATGSWTGVHWVTHSAGIAAEFPGIGRLDARLTM